jgi:hypothetical protein
LNKLFLLNIFLWFLQFLFDLGFFGFYRWYFNWSCCYFSFRFR